MSPEDSTDTSHCIPEARFLELLDESTARPEDLAHVRECPNCAARLAGMKRAIGFVEKLRGRVPPEVVARFQAKIHEALEQGEVSPAASANVDAVIASLSDPSRPLPTFASGGASPSGATPSSAGSAPAPFDPPEPPSPVRGRPSSRDDAIERITMPASAAEAANVPAPYDADAGSGLLERLGIRGKRLFALVLVLLVVALGIAFVLRRLG